MKIYSQFKKEALKNKKIKAGYAALGPEFEIIAAFIKRRLEKGFTQKELARRIGTKQSAIARLESGAYNPSLDFLKKVTHALDARLRITVSGR
ncbi:helix-turn-helix transcriptional regulator [Candidatus Wolfebacteria bacterium]|nr:helix-turn-helix transcriptional regulator [Candidatus Wolfebacteria bacterium]